MPSGAMLLLIDNYDSFVFNLARYVEELGIETRVARNDAITLDEIAALQPQALILSPGPCTPSEAGICEAVVRRFRATIPMLGVCLGHQAIVTALGGRLSRAETPVHGRTSEITHDASELFAGLPNPLRVARYHSLVAERSLLPACLSITSQTADGIIMSVRDGENPVFGVQFHPESVLTERGHELLANFLRCAGLSTRDDLPREKQPAESEFRAIGETFPIMRPVHW